MNVTSMLSRGYLQPFHAKPVETNRDQALAAQERQVLAQEQALKAVSGSDAKVTTTYRYSIGADGRRYISGAEVSIQGGSQAGNSGNKNVNLGEKAEAPAEAAQAAEKSKNNKENASDPETQAAVRELKRIEQEVIAHESAHQAAGGGLTGAVTYTYTKGPDGRSYITGGEVSIQMPVSDDPEQTLRDMEQVQRAALAPANPSSQDISIAGKAAAAAAQARQELAANARESDRGESAEFSPGVSSVKAGLLFERLYGQEENTEGSVIPVIAEEMPNSMLDPRKAYEQTASNRGLWTLDRGFEFVPEARMRQRFDIAA